METCSELGKAIVYIQLNGLGQTTRARQDRAGHDGRGNGEKGGGALDLEYLSRTRRLGCDACFAFAAPVSSMGFDSDGTLPDTFRFPRRDTSPKSLNDDMSASARARFPSNEGTPVTRVVKQPASQPASQSVNQSISQSVSHLTLFTYSTY